MISLPDDRSLTQRLELAVSMARAAGELTLRFFQQQGLAVERKSDHSPVTQADRQSEQLMRRMIEERFPSDAVLGEEYGATAGESGFEWVLDPIDGTKSFISGVPLYSVLIGVVWQRTSLIGVIHLPGLRETVYGAHGQGAWWVRGDHSPEPARVSSCRSLSEGLFLTSQVDSFAARGAAEAYAQLERCAAITRTWGDGYGYLLVATGRAVAMVDPVMNPWDAAPLQPVLTEAGGVFSDWLGRETIYGGEGVASNRAVHEEVLAITRAFTAPDAKPNP